jgi:uncharacterized membrane protein
MANPAPTGREAHTRSFVKAVTWRLTGSIDTFILSLLVTGNIKMAGAISALELMTKIFLYYTHERIWGKIPWGKKRG